MCICTKYEIEHSGELEFYCSLFLKAMSNYYLLI